MDTRNFFPLTENGITDIVTLCHVTYGKSHPPLDEHDHGNCFEAVFFMSGVQTYLIDDCPVTLNGGEFMISKPKEKHRTQVCGEEISDFYYMIFDIGPKRFFHFDEQAVDYIRSCFLSCKQKKFHMSLRLKELLKQIFAIKNERTVFARLQLEIYLPELFLEMLLSLENNRKQNYDDIREIVETIEQRPQEAYTIDMLAKSIDLSPSRFKQKFKEYSGISAMKFIMRRKIEKAKELLRKGELSVTEIAFELNFCSGQHFCGVFKKYTRLTPRQYKKAYSQSCE